mmetsp:Transcript_67823/g.189320  ORF Transcript_67823/g.189320 Transcript_67823/m.189320 type:complete len:207 (-) Transcript_67823:609-1229(-)
MCRRALVDRDAHLCQAASWTRARARNANAHAHDRQSHGQRRRKRLCTSKRRSAQRSVRPRVPAESRWPLRCEIRWRRAFTRHSRSVQRKIPLDVLACSQVACLSCCRVTRTRVRQRQNVFRSSNAAASASRRVPAPNAMPSHLRSVRLASRTACPAETARRAHTGRPAHIERQTDIESAPKAKDAEKKSCVGQRHPRGDSGASLHA